MIEAVVPRSSSKQVILKIPQYSQETPMLESLLNKVAVKLFIKKRLRHRYLPVNIAKMFKYSFCYRTLVAAFVLTLVHTLTD